MLVYSIDLEVDPDTVAEVRTAAHTMTRAEVSSVELGFRASIGIELEAVESFIGWRTLAGLLGRRLAGVGV